MVTGDLKRSADYYQRVFGCSVLKADQQTVRLSAGKCHISLRAGRPAGTVDHFAIGVDSFDPVVLMRDLKARGAVVSQGEAAGLHVTDPDGYPVQISANPAA